MALPNSCCSLSPNQGLEKLRRLLVPRATMQALGSSGMVGITRIFGQGTEVSLLCTLCRVKVFEIPNLRMSVRRRWSLLALSPMAECIRRRGPYVSLSSDLCEHAARGEQRWLRDQAKSLHPTRTSRMYARIAPWSLECASRPIDLSVEH